MPPPKNLTSYVAKHHKTHLIFDFDATLLLLHLPWSTWGDALKADLITIDPEPWKIWEKHHRLALARVQNVYTAKHGERALKVIRAHNERFENAYEKAEPNHELIREVKALSPDHKLFIWSSNVRSVLDHLLKETELADWFDKIVSRDDVNFIKPDPEGFALLYDPAVPKSRYLMIGDSASDRDAAAGAGIDFYHTDFFEQGL